MIGSRKTVQSCKSVHSPSSIPQLRRLKKATGELARKRLELIGELRVLEEDKAMLKSSCQKIREEDEETVDRVFKSAVRDFHSSFQDSIE